MRLTVLVALLAVLAGCSAPTEAPAPTAIDNPRLGVRLESLPDGFTMVKNEGSQLELAPTGDLTGRVWFQLGPEESNVNLVAAVHQHQAFVESQPGGVYEGAQELGTQIGTAFYSRGRFSENGGETEETVIFALHPSESRRLELHYRYPAGDDSSARVTALIGVLAEVGPIPPTADSGAE